MNYQQRYHQVLNYIDSHLEESLSVEKLSEIACLSKYHFHRQFTALFGMTVNAYIRQARTKRASYQLAFNKEMKIIDIALDNGYESAEAFSRAFSRSIGQTPSQFRKQPQWTPWYEKYQTFKQMRVEQMKSEQRKPQVDVIEFAGVNVASLTHTGSLELIGHTINQFIEWRKANKLPPSVSRTFNIVYDDPAVVAPEAYRCDICASVTQPVEENHYGVVNDVIPAGRCAVIRHIGSDDTLSETVSYLYSEWLAESGYELRDYPLFFERVTLFPQVAEAEQITDIYLPLQ